MSEEKSEPKKSILVAEDSPPNRRILVHSLEKLGFSVVECSNGEEAWTTLNKPESGEIIGVFSDLMMPMMDGLELLIKMRADKRWEALPFVLVSAVSDKTKVVRARELNVSGYLVKPIQFQKILEVVKKMYPTRKFDLTSIPGLR